MNMPVAPKYPGIYLEEISGSHPIEGVDTSTAAFVGVTARGPVNDPVRITGFHDFEIVFGGMCASSRLGYAVRDFFANGGRTALIVRILSSDATTADIPLNGFPARSL